MPASGTSVAEIIVVSFKARLVRLAQSAAAAEAALRASEVSRTSEFAARMKPSLECATKNWEANLNAAWHRARVFMTFLL